MFHSTVRSGVHDRNLTAKWPKSQLRRRGALSRQGKEAAVLGQQPHLEMKIF
jgi:hypothetical protein